MIVGTKTCDRPEDRARELDRARETGGAVPDPCVHGTME